MGNIAPNGISIGVVNINDYMNISSNFYAGNNHINSDNTVTLYRKSYSIEPRLNSISYDSAAKSLYQLNQANAINIYRTRINETKDYQNANENKSNHNGKINITLREKYIFGKNKDIPEKDLSPEVQISSHNKNQSNSPDRISPTSEKRRPYFKKHNPQFDDLKIDALSPFILGDSYGNNDVKEIYAEPEKNIISIENVPKIHPQMKNRIIEFHIPNLKKLRKINLQNLHKNRQFRTEIDEREENAFLNRPYINEPDYNLKDITQKSIDEIQKTMNSKVQELQIPLLKASENRSSRQLISPTMLKLKEIKLMHSSESPEKLSLQFPPFSPTANYKPIKYNHTSLQESLKTCLQTKDTDKITDGFELLNVKRTEIDMLMVKRSDGVPEEFKYALQNKYIGKKPVYFSSESSLANAAEYNPIFNPKIASVQSSHLLSVNGHRQVSVIEKLSPKNTINSVGLNSGNVNNNNNCQLFGNGSEKSNILSDHINVLKRPINKVNSIKSEKDLIINKHNQLSPNKVPHMTDTNKLLQLPNATTIRHKTYSSIPFFQ